jgi:hypothetical protein
MGEDVGIRGHSGPPRILKASRKFASSLLRSNSSGIQTAGPPCSWTFHESKVESGEYQDESNIHHEPFPEPVPEEQDVYRDDGSHQRHQEKESSRAAFHFRPQ